MKLSTWIVGIALLTSVSCGTPNPTPSSTAMPAVSGEHAEHDEAGHDEDKAEHAHEGEEAGHEGHEGEEAEGFIELTEAQKKQIGLVVAPAPMSSSASSGTRPGKVEADPDRRVIVSSQVAGTVQDFSLKIGSSVGIGQLVATVGSPEITELKAKYHKAEVEANLASNELTNKRSLLTVGDESRREVEESRLEVAKTQATREAVEARLEAATLSYNRLRKLVEEGIASRQQLEEATANRKALQAELKEAQTSIVIANDHLKREQSVAKSSLRKKAETLPAEAALARAREDMRDASQRLAQMGANTDESVGSVRLTSPINGLVIERPVTRGELISAGDPVAVLVDTSVVWVWVDLQRSDLNSVRIGDRVDIALASQPSVKAQGRLDYLDPQLSEESQTIRGRVILSNPPKELRLGSFVTAVIVSQGGGSNRWSIPKDAVQQVEGKSVVYVADGDGFRRTTVTAGAIVDGKVTVQGLPEAAKIAIKGSGDLKSMDLAGSIGGHSH